MILQQVVLLPHISRITSLFLAYCLHGALHFPQISLQDTSRFSPSSQNTHVGALAMLICPDGAL